uniref:4-nitrophenylphosphatase n=1 Tax=Megaselia scalaris TaxID=36166 RepID=T1GHW7_MEGSC
MVKHILNLTKEEKKDFLASFDNVFSDCDGVIWMVSRPINNVGPAFTLLQEAGKSIKFISNSSYRTDAGYIQTLSAIGIKDVKPDDLIHPDKTIITFLKSHPKYKSLFPIVGPIFKEGLISSGFKIDEMPLKTEEFTLQSFTESIIPSNPVDAVLIDIDLNLSLAKFCRALLHAKNNPDSKDVLVPGVEELIDYMENYTGKKSIILGKPGEQLGHHIMDLFNISCPKRNLFIGDNLSTDIGFANSLGFQTLFVLSGVHSYEDMMKAKAENKPTYFADGVVDFIQFFEELNK